MAAGALSDAAGGKKGMLGSAGVILPCGLEEAESVNHSLATLLWFLSA